MKKSQLLLLIILLSNIFFCTSKTEDKIKVPGIVKGDIITIRAKTMGTVTKVNFYEGKKVNMNDNLLTIDSRILKNKIAAIPLNLKSMEIRINELKNTIKYAEANRAYLLKQVKRFKRLVKSKSISGEKYELIKLKLKKVNTDIFGLRQKIASLEVEKEKLLNKEENLKLLLEDYTLNSPVRGVVIEKFISRGENILPSKPIADIIDLNSLYIEAFVEGEEISRLKIGDNANIFIDGIKEVQKGQISYFGKKAEFSPKYVISEKERKSLLYLVKIKIKDNIDIYKIGMPLTLKFDTAK